MSNFERKTYDNSYFFQQEVEKNHRNLMEFILKSKRIDKTSDAFRGIIDDVKRQQTSSILHSILMRDDVVLCINNSELPRAFKVFEAKDLRISKAPAIFIDVTGLITLDKSGYLVCKKIDVLITYLFGALSCILYREDPIKMVNNSNLSLSGTECFVAMFTYVLDYLRIIGYAPNKTKISYLAGLYFLHHMMGKDLDNYTKNIAAKVAGGLTMQEIRAYDLYLTDDCFTDIDSFVTMIAETFKLKGFNTEVFIQKWMYLFQTGTQYATELFTAFSILITNAYCGSYVVNQKQIERCCGSSMVKYSKALLTMGVDVLDKRGYMEAAELEEFEKVTDKAVVELKESVSAIGNIPNDMIITNEDYSSKEVAVGKAKALYNYLESSFDTNTKKSYQLTRTIYEAMKAQSSDNVDYDFGVVSGIVKESRKLLLPNDKRKILNEMDNRLSYLSDRSVREGKDAEVINRYNKAILELHEAKCLL